MFTCISMSSWEESRMVNGGIVGFASDAIRNTWLYMYGAIMGIHYSTCICILPALWVKVNRLTVIDQGFSQYRSVLRQAQYGIADLRRSPCAVRHRRIFLRSCICDSSMHKVELSKFFQQLHAITISFTVPALGGCRGVQRITYWPPPFYLSCADDSNVHRALLEPGLFCFVIFFCLTVLYFLSSFASFLPYSL